LPDRKGKPNASAKTARLTFVAKPAITAIGGNFV
jgi:hypothetical protein